MGAGDLNLSVGLRLRGLIMVMREDIAVAENWLCHQSQVRLQALLEAIWSNQG